MSESDTDGQLGLYYDGSKIIFFYDTGPGILIKDGGQWDLKFLRHGLRLLHCF